MNLQQGNQQPQQGQQQSQQLQGLQMNQQGMIGNMQMGQMGVPTMQVISMNPMGGMNGMNNGMQMGMQGMTQMGPQMQQGNQQAMNVNVNGMPIGNNNGMQNIGMANVNVNGMQGITTMPNGMQQNMQQATLQQGNVQGMQYGMNGGNNNMGVNVNINGMAQMSNMGQMGGMGMVGNMNFVNQTGMEYGNNQVFAVPIDSTQSNNDTNGNLGDGNGTYAMHAIIQPQQLPDGSYNNGNNSGQQANMGIGMPYMATPQIMTTNQPQHMMQQPQQQQAQLQPQQPQFMNQQAPSPPLPSRGQARERKLVEKTTLFMERYNPRKGSMPMERVRNVIKCHYSDLFTAVVTRDMNGSWFKFISSQPNHFTILPNPSEGTRAARFRLNKHEEWEEGDKQEAEEQKIRHETIYKCALVGLEKSRKGMEFGEFEKEYACMDHKSINPGLGSRPTPKLPAAKELARLLLKMDKDLKFFQPTDPTMAGKIVVSREATFENHNVYVVEDPESPIDDFDYDAVVLDGDKSVPKSNTNQRGSTGGLSPTNSFGNRGTGSPTSTGSSGGFSNFQPNNCNPNMPNVVMPTMVINPMQAPVNGLFMGMNHMMVPMCLMDGSGSPQSGSNSSTQPNSPLGSTASMGGSESDRQLFPGREENLKKVIREFMESPKTNPYQGSVPSERVQNCIKSQHSSLYKSVVGYGFGNQWHKFLAKHDDSFTLFAVEENKRSVWRIRLSNQSNWEARDRKERDDRKQREEHFVNCLTNYLLTQAGNKCRVDCFMEAYSSLPQCEAWAKEVKSNKERLGPDEEEIPDPAHNNCDDSGVPTLPPRGDFVRFVRRHPQRYSYDSKQYVVSLVNEDGHEEPNRRDRGARGHHNEEGSRGRNKGRQQPADLTHVGIAPLSTNSPLGRQDDPLSPSLLTSPQLGARTPNSYSYGLSGNDDPLNHSVASAPADVLGTSLFRGTPATPNNAISPMGKRMASTPGLASFPTSLVFPSPGPEEAKKKKGPDAFGLGTEVENLESAVSPNSAQLSTAQVQRLNSPFSPTQTLSPLGSPARSASQEDDISASAGKQIQGSLKTDGMNLGMGVMLPGNVLGEIMSRE